MNGKNVVEFVVKPGFIHEGFQVLIYEIFAAVGPYEDMRNSVVKKMVGIFFAQKHIRPSKLGG